MKYINQNPYIRNELRNMANELKYKPKEEYKPRIVIQVEEKPLNELEKEVLRLAEKGIINF